MRKNIAIVLLSVLASVAFFSCKCQKNGEQAGMQNNNKTEGSVRVIAPVIIYKTNADFYNNVPVILSEDKTDIVSFPDITDVFYNGKLAYPTRLENGYLLDNRGVGENVAFLKYTYEEYSKLAATPGKEELLKMIIAKHPLTELYKCNQLPKNNVKMLNEAIKKGLPNVCDNLMK